MPRLAHEVVTADELAAALAPATRPTATLAEAAAVINGLIEGWTRGASVVDGAVPRDLRAVGMAAALRLSANLAQWRSIGVEGQQVAGAFAGFTLHEQLVLNRYRRRSA